MSAPRPLEAQLLGPAERTLQRLANGHGDHARLDILEAFAARVGGWDLETFRSTIEGDHALSSGHAIAAADRLAEPIASSGIHPALAITALARPNVTVTEQRTTGAYYTDFRLATALATMLSAHVGPKPIVLDPASGTGILLVAFALTHTTEGAARTRLIGDGLCAADLSAGALRGARAALAALTSDLSAVRGLSERLRNHDSLLGGRQAWTDVSSDGFDALIGNPPWEKLKVSRHEHLRASGDVRHYGDDYEDDYEDVGGQQGDVGELLAARERLASYVGQLEARYPLAASGEPDLYKAFLELNLALAKPDGALGLLIPAGLIRSLGTKALRQRLFERAQTTSLSLMENRARFFQIDTRFKFLALTAKLGNRGNAHRRRITLTHYEGTSTGITETGKAQVTVSQLERMRPDLTLPEIRSQAELDLFERLANNGLALGESDNPWKPAIVREVDMTRDRRSFRRDSRCAAVPLIEGRMVHQFRSAAKSYRSGTGRRARWDVNPLGVTAADPQFFVRPDDLPTAARDRYLTRRIGFCDITGQTNERTVLAAIIEPGNACGNKVPTVLLPNACDEDALYTWVAVANSFAFDWLTRRVVTTTLNYFLLEGLPFPVLKPNGLPARRLAVLSRQVAEAEKRAGGDLWQLGQLRAEIDALVAQAYDLTLDDVELILDDFRLLDRGQPAIPGEAASTVTADAVLAAVARHAETASGHADRLEAARRAGAVPYVPGSFAETLTRQRNGASTDGVKADQADRRKYSSGS